MRELSPEIGRVTEMSSASRQLALTQYINHWAIQRRIEVDKLAESPIDVYQQAVDALELTGTETVLDLGCNIGKQLAEELARDRDHSGLLIGVDISEGALQVGRSKYAGEIDLVTADAEALPFADNSIGVMVVKNTLYHVTDKDKALKEAIRVAGKNGRIAVVTSAKDHKASSHKLLSAMLKVLELEDESLTDSFTTEIAEDLLPQYFNSVEKLTPHRSPIRLRHPECSPTDYERMVTFRRGLFTYILGRYEYWPQGATQPGRIPIDLLDQIFDEVAWPMIAAEIRKKGYFEDLINRRGFICEDPK